MNEPIVSPLLIYFAGISGGLSAILVILGIVLIIVSGVILTAILEKNKTPSLIKFSLSFIFAILLILSGVLIPNKETIYQIAIAKMTTPANINKVLDTGKSIKDGLKSDLIEVIRSFKENSSKGEKHD